MKKIGLSLSLEIEKYLIAQPLDQEYERVIADMTLANFNIKQVDEFVSKVFHTDISEVKTVNINKQPGPQPGYGGPNNHGQPGNDNKYGQNLDEMDDKEFENVLSGFIKSLKDV